MSQSSKTIELPAEERRVELRSQIDDALGQHERGELDELEDGEFSGWLNNQ